VFVSSSSLGRGWDRQADHADNPIFYQSTPLTAEAYHAWLHELAVGWVALPATKLDYAARAEGQLVAHGQSYLQLIWTTPQWRLYRVIDATVLVSGARVISVTGAAVTMETTRAAIVHTRIRWSPYLTTIDPISGARIDSCIINAHQWVDIYVPRAETFGLTSKFDPLHPRGSSNSDCIADLRSVDKAGAR
jgi:hypothetical protein